MEKSPVNRNIAIVANTPEIQAVKHNTQNLCQAVFYKAGEIQVSGKLKLVADNPGIVLLKMEGDKVAEISVSDPNRELGRCHLSISDKIEKRGENFVTIWNERTGMTHIAIDLPQGVYAGQSVTVAFR